MLRVDMEFLFQCYDDDFPKISDHFIKIFEDLPKVVRSQTNVPNIFKNFQRLWIFPKVTEDFGERNDDVLTHLSTFY